jgi:hypothetical protein
MPNEFACTMRASSVRTLKTLTHLGPCPLLLHLFQLGVANHSFGTLARCCRLGAHGILRPGRPRSHRMCTTYLGCQGL